MRAEHEEWGWLDPLFDEVAMQRREGEERDRVTAELVEDKAKRDKAFGALKKWFAGSWFVAALALGGGLVDYGTRRGRSESEATASAKARADIEMLKDAATGLRLSLAELVRDVRGLERQLDRRLGDPP